MSEWFDVTDESIPLPENLQCVLVWLEYTDLEGERKSDFDFADFHAPSKSNQWFQPYAYGHNESPVVTHWMPIPGAPK